MGRREETPRSEVRRYALSLSAKALDWLEACRDVKLKARISAAIEALATEPRPAGSKKLKGEDHAWRVRVGDYRVLYEVHDEQLVLLVIRIAKRDDAFR
jgi:mRNA interferase RelE/StbE